MTLCKVCKKGERAGEHDPYTGIAPNGHKYIADMTDTFHDRFVANRHKEGSY